MKNGELRTQNLDSPVQTISRNFRLRELHKKIRQRLQNLFIPDTHEHIPALGSLSNLKDDPHWKDNYLFFEYFNGDTGEGIGANHQTGWTSLITEIITN